jgi:hypothetical protein
VSALAPLRTATDEDNGPEVAGAILNLFRVLIGEERFPEFLAKRPSMDDLTVLMEGAFAEYGVTLGESSASNES